MDILQSSFPFSFTVSRDDSEALTTSNNSFPARLRASRLKAKLKRRTLARLLEINVATLIRWEKGVCEPTPDSCNKIYRLLGASAFPKLTKLQLSQKIKFARLMVGLDQTQAAQSIGQTLHWWLQFEHHKKRPDDADLKLLRHFIRWASNS